MNYPVAKIIEGEDELVFKKSELVKFDISGQIRSTDSDFIIIEPRKSSDFAHLGLYLPSADLVEWKIVQDRVGHVVLIGIKK